MTALRSSRLILLALLLVAGSVSAQELRLTLTMSPKPSPYISEWQSRKETATLTIINSSGKSVDAKLRAKVTLDDAMRAETKNEAMPILAVPPGVSTYAADQLFPGDAVRFSGGIDKTATKTGMLPAGVYQLCVDLIAPADARPLSAQACRQFSITSYQLPVLQLPENGKTLAAAEKPTFRWTPVVPLPQGGVRYMLRIFEVLPGQSPSSQLQNGFPVFEREVMALTQLLWPPEFVLPEKSATYAWSVQTIDPVSGNPIGDQNGYAEPFTFKTGTPTPGGGGTVVAKGDSLGGIVRDFFSNDPIASAKVVYHRASLAVKGAGKFKMLVVTESKDSLVATTDAQGRFVFTGLEGVGLFTLRGSASGYLTSTEKSTGSVPAGSVTNFILPLKPNIGTITGRVVDSLTNRGLNNISVQLWRKRSSTAPKRGLLTGGSGPAKLLVDDLIATVLTGDESSAAGKSLGGARAGAGGAARIPKFTVAGSFTFEDVDGGDGYYIVIAEPSYHTRKTALFAVSAQQTADKGKLLLQPKVGRIEGWVKEEGTNKPLGGAQVYLHSDVGTTVNMANAALGGLGAGGWNAAMGNAGQAENYKGYLDAKGKNEPFIPKTGAGIEAGAGGITVGGGTKAGGGAAGGKTGGIGVNWSDMSAWTPGTSVYGQQPPPTKPDTTPKYGPVVTDQNGYFVFENVRINDPAQGTDRYAVWAKTPGFYDAYKPARLSAAGQTKQVTLLTKVAKGIIHGKAISKVDDSPIGGVKVELQKAPGMGKTEPVTAVWTTTSPDGTYTLFGIDKGSYSRVRFSKSGVSEYLAAGPIAIDNGTVMELNASIEVYTGSIKGTVNDQSNQPLAGVIITCPALPDLMASTFVDGTYMIPNVPLGKYYLTFSQPGFVDFSDSAKVFEKDKAFTLNAKMTGYKGTIRVVVQDAKSLAFLQNAKVELSGAKLTNVAGEVVYADIPIGQKKLTVTADTSGGKDYAAYSTNVNVVKGDNGSVVVKLDPAARVSGKVENTATLGGVDSANVTVEGLAGVKTTAGPDGSFTLRNVPAGVPIVVKAAWKGFKTGKALSFTLAEGEQKSGVLIQLEPVPLTTLYGFNVEVEKIEEKFGKRYVTGDIIGVPDNPVMKLQTKSFKFPFTEIELDNDYKAVPVSYEFAINELPINIFGLKGTLTDSLAFLKVRYIDSVGAGMIYGNKIALGKFIPSWIPGAKWSEEKVTWAANLLPPGMYSDGVFHANAAALGVNVTGTSVSTELFGFKISVDYTKTTINDQGLKYTGTLKIPGIPNTIAIEDLHIALKDPETGAVKFMGVTVKTVPPITINLGLFKLTDSTASWGETGFKASGMVELTALGNKKFGFKDLWIGPNGDFLGITINPDPANNKITLFGQTLTITSLGMGTEAAEPKRRFFHFSGKLAISAFDKPIEFQDLKYFQDGEFTGTIAFNQSVKFFSVITLQLQSVEFNKDAKGKFFFIKGGVKFEIPMLSVQVGNFRFYENGQLAVEQIGLGFTAGPVQVAATMSWSNNVFEGSATLIIQPVFNVTAAFRYASSNDWWIKIKANIPPLPIGPFTIVGIAGELGYNYGYWTFGFGGTVTVGNAKEAIKLELYVKVTTSPSGPVIQGDATVIIMSGVTIGTATILLDFPNSMFTGSINFGWDKKTVKVQAWIDIAVKAGDYWFVGAGVKVDLLNLVKLDVALYVAKNYGGYMHTLPVAFHPDNSKINGFHLDGTLGAGWGKDGDAWHLDLKLWAYLAIDYDQGLSGGFKVHGSGSFDLWVVGGSGVADLEAAVQYNNNRLKFHAYAGIDVKLWIWNCDKDSDCDDWCAGCWGVSVTVDYDSGADPKWNADVDW